MSRGVLITLVLFLVLAGPTLAQQVPDGTATSDRASQADQIRNLEQQVDALRAQLQALTRTLEAMKAQQAKLAEKEKAERLRRAAARAAAAAKAGKEEVSTAETRFTSGTRMQPQLNPEISATGNMFVQGGDEETERFDAGEWEVDIQSYLDPFSKMHFVLANPSEGSPEVEEAYITWLNLPGGLSLTAGKKRAQFGVLNRWHAHALDQIDYPWVITESFGDEGLSATGFSFDWLIPHPWASANELTVEIMNGDNDTAFGGSDWDSPTYLARLKNYWDLNADSYLEVGLNGVTGESDPLLELESRFAALDFAYNWYPAGRGLYREFTLRGMLLRSNRERAEGSDSRAWGGYAYAQFKFSPHWISGLRFDRVDDQWDDLHHYWGVSPYLTWWQSEFVRLRAQFSYRDDNLLGADRRYWLQITLAAGPHKHENY